MQLSGRRILITGAASGIGHATARLFSEQGASIGLIDQQSIAVVDFQESGGSVAAAECDVTSAVQVLQAVDDLASRLNGIDGVVNAAGVSLRSSLEDTSPEDWSRVIGINLTGPYNVCRAVLPHLRQAGKGTIVNVASGAAFKPSANFSAYCASKGGLVSFTRGLAFDIAREGLRANSVCPGVIDTPMIERALRISPEPDAAHQRFLDASAMRRMGTADEIANVILFLTSDASSFVNGAAFSADGGGAYH